MSHLNDKQREQMQIYILEESALRFSNFESQNMFKKTHPHKSRLNLTHHFAYAAQAFKYTQAPTLEPICWIKDIPYQLAHSGAGNEGIYSNERGSFWR